MFDRYASRIVVKSRPRPGRGGEPLGVVGPYTSPHECPGEFGSVRDVSLVEDHAELIAHGVLAHPERTGNFLVGETFGRESRDLELTTGQNDDELILHGGTSLPGRSVLANGRSAFRWEASRPECVRGVTG